MPNQIRLKDVQSGMDNRNISLDKVGVKGVLYPIKVCGKQTKPGTKLKFNTVASFDMYVSVPHHQRGIHMSRLIEVLNKYHSLIDIISMKCILSEMRNVLNAETAYIQVRFIYFIDKAAPKTGAKGKVGYPCAIYGSLDINNYFDLVLEAKVPIMTVCPCSKRISDEGAHNQRGIITVRVRWAKEIIWLEDLIANMESCGSSDLYSILKRPDEKYVTEYSHDHPKFVEDVARDAADLLCKDDNIAWFRIEVENFESIHNHSAFASIEKSNTICASKEEIFK